MQIRWYIGINRTVSYLRNKLEVLLRILLMDIREISTMLTRILIKIIKNVLLIGRRKRVMKFVCLSNRLMKSAIVVMK